MASSLPTDDALWARVDRQARCAGSGLDPDQPDRRIRNDRAAAIPRCRWAWCRVGTRSEG